MDIVKFTFLTQQIRRLLIQWIKIDSLLLLLFIVFDGNGYDEACNEWMPIKRWAIEGAINGTLRVHRLGLQTNLSSPAWSQPSHVLVHTIYNFIPYTLITLNNIELSQLTVLVPNSEHSCEPELNSYQSTYFKLLIRQLKHLYRV